VPSQLGYATRLTVSDGTVKKAVPQASGQLRYLTQMVYICYVYLIVRGWLALSDRKGLDNALL